MTVTVVDTDILIDAARQVDEAVDCCYLILNQTTCRRAVALASPWCYNAYTVKPEPPLR